jgi:hypothetical protein
MPLSAPRLCALQELLGDYITHHVYAVYRAADADLRDALGTYYSEATPAQVHAFICELVAFHVGGAAVFEGPFDTPEAWRLTHQDECPDITTFLDARGCNPS